MFDTIHLFRKIGTVFTFIPQNPMYLELESSKEMLEIMENPYVVGIEGRG